MESRLSHAPFGRPSVHALARAVEAAKAGDPLAPVTVVVPSNTAGLSLRRGLPAVTGTGLVNVRFLVLARLAELLGAPRLAGAGRRPLTPAVRAACVEAALRDAPGVFAAVADHPSTARALDAAFRELRAAPSDALDRLVHAGGRAGDVVRLFRRFRHLAADRYDEDDLAAAGADAVREGDPALRDVGEVVLHLPGRLTPSQLTLVDALAGDGRLHAVLGRTGEPVADAPSGELEARLAGQLGPPRTVEAAGDATVEVVSAPDPETELRLVARRVVEGLADDPPVPLHRVAVLTRQPAPYALLAHGVLGGAGIRHNGPAVRTLAHVTAGRVLLGLLALPDRQFRRTDVAAWLASGPVRDAAGDVVPAGRWDRLSKEAGIVRGPRQWDQRLAKLEHREDRRLAEALEHLDEPEDADARRDRHAAEVGRIRALRSFVAEAVERLGGAPAGTWADVSAWALELLQRYLGTEGHLASWPDEELEGYRRVAGVLGDLGSLDEVHPHPDLATFRRALERELQAPAGRVGRFGDGVFVGRLADAVGLDVDRVFVVGMVEGAFPPRAPLDALLSDADRRATGGGLRTLDDRRADERRTFLAAMAAAPSRVLSAPRVDPRSAREAHQAPWLAEQDVAPHVVASFAALVQGAGPASMQERDLADLWAWHDGSLPADHPLLAEVPSLAAGVAAVAARNGGDFTEWDGHVGAQAGLFHADEPLSATRVEDWALCPRRYLLGRVLGLREVEEPEEFATLSARDRGSLVHEVLERLVRGGDCPPSPEERWSDGARERAVELAEQVCDEYEREGRTGTSLLWRLERGRITADVLRTLEEDDRLRAARGVSPVGVEVAFGIDGTDPVTIELDDGRLIPFRGFIDRVDRSPDGSRLVVLDYKTGRRPDRGEVEQGMVRGTKLQLPLYAQAARDRYGATEVEAYYWHVSEQGGWGVFGYPVDEARLARLRHVLSTIVHGIEDGVFPGRPGDEDWRGGFDNCRWCAFDRVCPSDRDRAWDRMRDAPELSAYVALSEATPDEDEP